MWDGDGAARVYAREGGLLLERAGGQGPRSPNARTGRDEARRILLHRRRAAARSQADAAARTSSPWRTGSGNWSRPRRPTAASCAGAPTPREPCWPHHGRSASCVATCTTTTCSIWARGWLAIDPKRLLGERGFGFANIFTNPDLIFSMLPPPPGFSHP